MSEGTALENPRKAVVFDLDDTLYCERDYVRSGYRAVAASMAADPAAAEAVAAWMWRRFCEGRGERMFNAAAERFGLPDDPATIAGWVACYRDHAPILQPHPDAVAVLDALRGRVRLGLLSDGFLPAQSIKLDALGLRGYFDAIVFTEAMGRDCWKPSAAGFERIAAELGVPHACCAYVGDNPAKDFVAPNALGWLTIQWRRDGQVHADKPAAAGGAAQIVVRDAAALLAALDLGVCR
ncbi:MAG: HAD family hydrolase [Planctomycetes bacterium]|nr:HAD family hydrolase [Planctomycetota bacterium]